MFKIKVTNLHWLENMDETEDKCLHGHAWVQIGDEHLEYENATVSATAFYLLKSLVRSDPNNYRAMIQYLPCCGFDMSIWKGEVILFGCPNGVDWSVIHEDGMIRLVTESRHEVMIPFDEYRKTVYAFADEIEAFYRNAKEKMFNDEEEREVYAAFWKEWHQIRDRYQ